MVRGALVAGVETGGRAGRDLPADRSIKRGGIMWGVLAAWLLLALALSGTVGVITWLISDIREIRICQQCGYRAGDHKMDCSERGHDQ